MATITDFQPVGRWSLVRRGVGSSVAGATAGLLYVGARWLPGCGERVRARLLNTFIYHERRATGAFQMLRMAHMTVLTPAVNALNPQQRGMAEQMDFQKRAVALVTHVPAQLPVKVDMDQFRHKSKTSHAGGDWLNGGQCAGMAAAFMANYHRELQRCGSMEGAARRAAAPFENGANISAALLQYVLVTHVTDVQRVIEIYGQQVSVTQFLIAETADQQLVWGTSGARGHQVKALTDLRDLPSVHRFDHVNLDEILCEGTSSLIFMNRDVEQVGRAVRFRPITEAHALAVVKSGADSLIFDPNFGLLSTHLAFKQATRLLMQHYGYSMLLLTHVVYDQSSR